MKNISEDEKAALKALGKRLKAARLAKFGARSKRVLERESGVTNVMIGLIEDGKTNPTFLTLRRLETALSLEGLSNE